MIFLVKDRQILVDDADHESIVAHSWYLEKSRSKTYLRSRIDGKLVRLHQFILGETAKGKVVDHINGNTFDNRRENLRVCSGGQNIQRGYLKKNKYMGVSYYARDKNYRVRVGKKHIGYFNDQKSAAIAYNNAAVRMYGNLAKINDIGND